jgi:peptide deformylase
MKLVVAPNSVLKSQASDWVFVSQQDCDDAEQVEREMIEIMKTHNGRGLAANQVGLLSRVFIIQLEGQPQPTAMFNPRVISASEDLVLGEEGCLSFPDLWLDVKRAKTIEAAYLDKTGKECIITLVGIDARCFLHELDHLNGVCFTDKVGAIKLAMAIKKQKQKKRKYNG